MDAGFVVGKLKMSIRIFLVVGVIFDLDNLAISEIPFTIKNHPSRRKGGF